jgi:hypothetical protein
VTRKLQLGANLSLPIDAVTQTFAFMGKRGAGKSFSAGKLVEEMLGAGAQVVIKLAQNRKSGCNNCQYDCCIHCHGTPAEASTL